MPRPRKHEEVREQFHTWKIYRRAGVWCADGRSNEQGLGRHSLGTRDYAEARKNLRRLDLKIAVQLKKADPSILTSLSPKDLELEAGRELYRQRVTLPRVAGGASENTWKRYRPVFDKFFAFLRKRHIRTWNCLQKEHLEAYATWLDGEHYAYRTQFLELTTIKQVINYLIKIKRLPADCRIDMPLPKPHGSDTYCWTLTEVNAMLAHCAQDPELAWLGQVLTALTYTGMRISELAGLRWVDVDMDKAMIILKDETASRSNLQDRRSKGRSPKRKQRQTKGRRSRTFPIHPELITVLATMERASDGVVFHGPLGGSLSPDVVRRALIRDVLEPLAPQFPTCDGDIGFIDGRLHSFRHLFCSVCANSGVPEQMVMSWLGHQESKMVRHYYHAHQDEAQRQMKRISFVKEPSAT